MKEPDVEKLETISVRLENIPKEKRNRITEDMDWLVRELRVAWLEVERIREQAGRLVDAGDWHDRTDLIEALRQISDGELKP